MEANTGAGGPWLLEDELTERGQPCLPLNIWGSGDPFRLELKQARDAESVRCEFTREFNKNSEPGAYVPQVFGRQPLTSQCEHEEMDEDERSGFPLVSAIAVCGLALLAALTAPFWWGPTQNRLGPFKDWLPLAPSSEQLETEIPHAPAAAWTDKEIEIALMQCVKVLAPVTAELTPLEPIRDGDCGTPAPLLVKSIGETDKVSFDPALVLDCDMVVALDRWLRESVQPAAKEAFSSPVSKIIGSSYACRNVYNLLNGHLSQHAFANAIDVPLFVLADGRKVDVTHGWGPTQRALIAAANAKKATSAITQKTEKSVKDVSDVVKVSAAASIAQPRPVRAKPRKLILELQPQLSSCVLRTMVAATYSRRRLAQRPTTCI